MSSMDVDCAHHKHKTMQHYMDNIETLWGWFNHDQAYQTCSASEKRALKLALRHEFEKGFCFRCAVYLVSNFNSVFCNHSQMEQLPFLMLNQQPQMLNIKDEDVDFLRTLLLNCLQHPCAADVIFNKSSLWTRVFLVFRFSLNSLTVICQRMASKNKKERKEAMEASLSKFQNAAVFAFQLIRNLKLIKNIHWGAVGNLDMHFVVHSPSLESWIRFLEFQLETEIYLRTPFGKELFACVQILLCFVVHYWYGKSYSDKISKYLSRLNTAAARSFRQPFHDQRVDHVVTVRELMMLRHPGLAAKMQAWYSSLGKQVWSLKWKEMQCISVGCRNRRKVMKKFYKCRKCKTARYCSKRCQKLDWNHHGHREICRKLCKMRRNKNNLSDMVT